MCKALKMIEGNKTPKQDLQSSIQQTDNQVCKNEVNSKRKANDIPNGSQKIQTD